MQALCLLKSQLQLPDWYSTYAQQRGLQARQFSGNMDIRYAEGFARYRPWVGQVFP